MKYDVAMKWADELESDKYQQGTGLLRNSDNQYCCLGVLCDILPTGGKWVTREVPGGVENLDSWVWAFAINSEDGLIGSLPKPVMVAAGLKSEFGTYEEDPIIGESKGLSAMNDTGVSFKEIAAFIRVNWERL